MTKSQPVLSRFPLAADLEEEFRSFKENIEKSENILISSTSTADGDSIGAQIGLLYLIEGLSHFSKLIKAVNHTEVPRRYQFLDASERILSWEVFQRESPDLRFDLGISMDGGIERTGDVEQALSKIEDQVLIDHHQIGSQRRYKTKILDLDSSSTCEIVYLLFEYFGLPINQKIAAALYVGMVFDTGFFKHNLTKPRTHHVAAELISTGIDFSSISDRALLQRSIPAQEMLRIMMQNLKYDQDGLLAISYWTADDLQSVGFEDGDQEGLINQLYFTEGVEMVVLLAEHQPREIKASFRSKGVVNVAEFARSLNIEGGGHIRAAGCSLEGDIFEHLNSVREAAKRLLSS